MRIEKANAVFKKDWREIRNSYQVMLPIVAVPMLFSIVVPFVVSLVPADSANQANLRIFLSSLPAYIRNEMVGMGEAQAVSYVLLGYVFAPLFLIVPIMSSSVIASDSFAGEKERRTIEALLATPLTDGELFIGKIMVCFIPSMLVTVASSLLYWTIVDLTTFAAIGNRLPFPNLMWMLVIFLLAPMLSLASIGLTVTISARVKGFKEAQQISVILILPLIGIILSQASGTIFFGPTAVIGTAALLVLLDAMIFGLGVKLFGREKILQRLT